MKTIKDCGNYPHTRERKTWFNFASFAAFKQNHYDATERCKELFKKWIAIDYDLRFEPKNQAISDNYAKVYNYVRSLNQYGIEIFPTEYKKDKYIQSNIKL